MGDGEFKQPYLYGEGKTALETPMQAEIYSSAPEMESQWKQPWRYDSYPKMEAEMSWPGWPPPWDGDGGGGDCTPKGNAVGGGSVDPCQPGVNCGQWVFTCAHRITKFSVVQDFGWIQSIAYGADDTVTVTVCWNEGDRAAGRKVGVKAVGANGKGYISEVDMNTCCPDKAVCTKACGQCVTLSIGYTSQQMAVNGTQNLIATGGGGKYTWSFSGGGSLNKTKGSSTTYTAPATNAECALNPTITLKDCCGDIATLEIAVNAYSNNIAGYTIAWGPAESCYRTLGVCSWQIHKHQFLCSGTAGDALSCSPGHNLDCTIDEFYAWCTPETEVESASCSCSDGCAEGTHDTRSAEYKTAGCCPWQLL